MEVDEPPPSRIVKVNNASLPSGKRHLDRGAGCGEIRQIVLRHKHANCHNAISTSEIYIYLQQISSMDRRSQVQMRQDLKY